MAAGPDSIRLDKWLWQARFAKSRSLAAALVARGRVRLNRTVVKKPATPVRVGDGLTIAVGHEVRALTVLGLGTRRGPAPEARLLYAEFGAGGTGPDLEPGGQADT